jgi:hypothetical protein
MQQLPTSCSHKRRSTVSIVGRKKRGDGQMVKSTIDVDEVLKNLASRAVTQGGNLRANVRDVTVQALQARELSLSKIREVLRSVTEGINIGVAKTKGDVAKPLADALGGMDDALQKAVQASHIALQQLTDQGVDFKDSKIKKVLNDLERLEDEFLKTVKQAATHASAQVRPQWVAVLKAAPESMGTGAQVDVMMERFGEPVRSAIRKQREMGMKAAHVMTQNFATLASGVLIGLSEVCSGQRRRHGAGRRREWAQRPRQLRTIRGMSRRNALQSCSARFRAAQPGRLGDSS